MIKKNHLIMGSAIGLAAIAIAIDHTQHRLPEPAGDMPSFVIEESASPCSLESSPCSLDESPCALNSSPCSL